jgi:hypothetical protein
LIVFGGEHGDGFSMQATLEHTLKLPQMLREIADKIELDLRQL